MVGTRHDLDAIAARVARGDEGAHAALLALVLRAVVDRAAGLLELDRGGVERLGIAQVEPDRVVARLAFEVHERVVARVAARAGLVGAEVRGLALARHELQPDDRRRVLDRRLEVGRTDPEVADVAQVDHSAVILSAAKNLLLLVILSAAKNLLLL